MQALYDAARAAVQAAHKVGALSEAELHRHVAALDSEDPGYAEREREAQAAAAQAERDELARLQAKYPEVAAESEAAEKQRLADLQARAAEAAAKQEAERRAATAALVPGGGFNQAAGSGA